MRGCFGLTGLFLMCFSLLARSRDCSYWFFGHAFGSYRLNVLQSDKFSNTNYVLGHYDVLESSLDSILPRLTDRAKMTLSRPQNIFMHANIDFSLNN